MQNYIYCENVNCIRTIYTWYINREHPDSLADGKYILRDTPILQTLNVLRYILSYFVRLIKKESLKLYQHFQT